MIVNLLALFFCPLSAVLNFLFLDLKDPRQIKAKPDLAFPPIVVHVRKERPLVHALRVRKMQLKNVAARLDIEADGERVLSIVLRFSVESERIIGHHGYSFGDFISCAD
mgnify:CR=1 FL=1